jgi:molybdopterin-guanine dinucleotide biosynthesis protein A
MGRDKARVMLRGRPLILHVAGALAPVAASITVVGRREADFEDLGLRTIADRRADAGPLGGLDAALADLAPHRRWLLLCSCDLAGLRRAWIERLWRRRAGDARCVVYRGGFMEPLPGLYHASLRRAVARRLREGRLALHELVADTRRRELPIPGDWGAAVNVNTAGDLERYRRGRG